MGSIPPTQHREVGSAPGSNQREGKDYKLAYIVRRSSGGKRARTVRERARDRFLTRSEETRPPGHRRV